MKTNILVFPCGTEIGLEIHRSLGFSTHINLLGASSSDDHGKYVYENYIGGLPFVDDEKFIKAINAIVDANNIEFIFPAHDSVVLNLSEAEASGELACKVITSPVETCRIARSKDATYKALVDAIPVPEQFTADEVAKFPVFLKPDVGQGSKGTHVARTRTDLDFYLHEDPTLLIVEYLPREEFTIDCFTNRHGDLLFSQARIRERVSGGISVSSRPVEDEILSQLAARINDRLRFRGAWFFQVKKNASGEFVLMEIATRIAGTMGMVRCQGVNLALLSVFDALDMDVEIYKNNYDISIDRALSSNYKLSIEYSHVYIDFDDLIIFNGKVNALIISFLFQCINEDITLHLITKHEKDITQTLQTYRLQNIFDEVISVDKTSNKRDYIKHKDAIFIDDSFQERAEIHHEYGIPVFDSHMVEALIKGER
jgi:hypothetical protein